MQLSIYNLHFPLLEANKGGNKVTQPLQTSPCIRSGSSTQLWPGIYSTANENPLQKHYQHQKQSDLEIVFYLPDHKSWEIKQKTNIQQLNWIQRSCWVFTKMNLKVAACQSPNAPTPPAGKATQNTGRAFKHRKPLHARPRAASPAPDTAGDASAAGPGTAHPGELEGWQDKASPQLRVFSASLAHRVGTHQGSATRLGLFSSGSCLSTLCRTPDLQASQVRR